MVLGAGFAFGAPLTRWLSFAIERPLFTPRITTVEDGQGKH
jgi:hypothetical protein